MNNNDFGSASVYKAYVTPMLNIIFLCIIGVYPFLIVKTDYYSDLPNYPWYFGLEHQQDYFLQFRAYFLVALAAAMLCISVIKLIKEKHRSTVLIILGIYAVTIVVSTINSINRHVSLFGGLELHESVFVLLAYLSITLFMYLHGNEFICFINGKFFGTLIRFIAVLIVILGIVQEKEVYLTFYNPDYASVYLLFLISAYIYMTLIRDNRILRIYDILMIILLSIIVYKTECRTNIFLIAFEYIIILGFLIIKKRNRRLLNKYLCGIIVLATSGVICLLVAGAVTLDDYNTSGIEYIKTTGDGVIVKTTDDCYTFTDNSEVSSHQMGYRTCAKRIDGELINGFSIENEYESMFFAYSDKDLTYYFVPGYGKYLSLNPATKAVYSNNYSFLGRGYIWAISIPLIKKYILFGCGPDAYVYAVPHNDYIASLKAGFLYSLITKPHSLYLQILIQTGIVSLLCLLALVIMAFWYNVRSKDLDNGQFIIIVAMFLYLISGVMNDSCVAVAPYFWLILGLALYSGERCLQS